MRITSVEPILLSVPLEAGGFTWSGGAATLFSVSLVRIRTEYGVEGVGDIYGMGCFAPEATIGLINWIGAQLIGEDAMEPAATVQSLWSRSLFWGRSGALVACLSAVENALWDITGQAHGVPVYELLGGPVHEQLPIYASGGLDGSRDTLRAELEQYLRHGFQTVKIRIGRGIELDREKVAFARGVLGMDVNLAVDAVMGHHPRAWSAAEALTVAHALEEHDLAWLEEPCAAHDYEGYATVRAESRIPISGGESSCMLAEFQNFFRQNSLDIVQPDAVHCGGIAELLRVGEVAASHGVQVAPHSWGSGATLMANYHAAFACPSACIVELPTYGNPLTTELLEAPLDIRNGYLHPPRAPGLGLRLRQSTIDRYPYRPGSSVKVPAYAPQR